MGMLMQVGGWICLLRMCFNSHVIVIMREVWGTLSYTAWFWKGVEKGSLWFPNIHHHFHEDISHITFPNLYSIPATNCHSISTWVCCSYLRFIMSPPLYLSLQFPSHFKAFPFHARSVTMVPNWVFFLVDTRLFKPFDLFHIPFYAWNIFFHQFAHSTVRFSLGTQISLPSASLFFSFLRQS